MLDKSFREICDGIKKDVKDTQLEIMINANTNLVNLYYRIGKIISENYSWGNKFVENVSFELKNTFPTLKGFSARNLNYMKAFYEEYKDDEEFLHCLNCAKLPWKHNITLMQKVKDKNIRKWYMEKCLEEGWSKNILIYQIDTDLYKRQVENVKHNNFKVTLKENSDLANNIMKEPYVDDNDNPSIGIILCSSKNNQIVDYTLKYINKSLGVSEYKIFNELPNNLLKDFPTEDELNLYMDIDEE